MKTNYLNHQEVVPQHQANSSKTNCETIQKHIKENIHYILSDFWMENMPSASTHGQYPFIKQFWEGLLSDGTYKNIKEYIQHKYYIPAANSIFGTSKEELLKALK